MGCFLLTALARHAGRLAFSTIDNKLYFDNGNEWVKIGLEITLSAGDGLIGFSNSEFTFQSMEPIKAKEIKLLTGSGSLRFEWEMHGTLVVSDVNIVYAQIYRNGNAVGAVHSVDSSSYQSVTEEIAGWNAGDTVQLYVWSNLLWDGYVRNFRIYADINGLTQTIK